MVNFYVYSFSIAAIPLLLGVLLIWFGKKLWKKANAENAKYQQRYTGRTTLRVIGVEKHEREERDSNESGEIIYVTSYTPIYSSPAFASLGTLSPVNALVFSVEVPSTTTPSIGTFSPG